MKIFRCIRNCFPLVPLTNTKLKTSVGARCIEGCEKFEKGKTFKWVLTEKSGSYQSPEVIGKNVFVIKPEVMKPGLSYTLKGQANGVLILLIVISFYNDVILVEKAEPAYFEIDTHNPGKIISCSINPKSGKAFNTIFMVNCDYTGSKYVWKIYSLKEDSGE